MRFFVETYGCTMNQGEGKEMERKIVSLGHSIAPNSEEAQVVIVNTCVVIKATELKILRRMRELQEGGKQLVITGCMASAPGMSVLGEFPEALMLPLSTYDSFERVISESYGTGEKISGRVCRLDSPTYILPIAQGCLGHCSYCITRITRGGLRSYPPAELARLAETAISDGAKELLVTAQDTACYGKDIGASLGELLERLCAIDGDFMIRIGMMNPDSLRGQEDDLAHAFRNEKVYKFLHLPVQTGSDRLLKAMGRNYRTRDFEEQVRVIREAVPRLTLSTDIICGFPGESDEDHRASVELLNRIRPNIVNVTRFSGRPGTPAERMEDQIVGRIAKERSRALAKLRFEIASEITAKMIGETVEAVATEEGKNGSTVCRDIAYVPIAVPGRIPLGSRVKAIIMETHATHLVGRLAN